MKFQARSVRRGRCKTLTRIKEIRDSAEIESAVIKLYDMYVRIQKLSYAKLESYGSQLLIRGPVDEKDIVTRVKEFSEALTGFIRLRATADETLDTFGNGLKSLTNAADSKEILALIGLTALSDRKEYNRLTGILRKQYHEKLEPAIPEMKKIFKWIKDSIDFSESIDELINRDLVSNEDEFIGMIIAMRDHDIRRFNELYQELEARIKLEESKSSD
jgi:hypothetical protein